MLNFDKKNTELEQQYQFLTIKNATEAAYKEKGSKFIAYTSAISNEEDFKLFLDDIKSQHPTARHFCYAFRLAVNGEVFRYNDDGEPKNSAGFPIYGQLLSKELTFVAVIVVRYFGGTKLGVGGLVNAYKTAAKLALDEAEVVIKKLTKKFELTYSYELTSTVNSLIHQMELPIISQKFETDCTLVVEVELDKIDEFKNKVQQSFGVGLRDL